MAAAAATTTGVPEEGVLLYMGTTTWDLIGKRLAAEEQGVWSPHRVSPQITVRSIFSGVTALHCLLVDTSGTLFSWGKNASGQLGHGDSISRGEPTVVEALQGEKVRHAACGRSHTLVLTEGGEVFSFGLNKSGQLGHGVAKDKSLKPMRVPNLEDVKLVGCGNEFSAAVTTDGAMYTWGSPENGCLGHGTDGKYFITASKLTFDFQLAPVKIEAFVKEDAQIEMIGCGDQHTVAVDTKMRVWSWGFGGYGRLGHGEQKDEHKPKQIDFFGPNTPGKRRDPTPIKLIAAGGSCCYLTTTLGRSYFWGRVKSSGEATMYPKPVGDLNGWNVNAIAAGKTHTVVSADKALISWGPSPTTGELGYGDPAGGAPKSSTVPKLVDSLADCGPFQVACGSCFTLLVVSTANEDVKKKIEALPILEPVECPHGQGQGDDEDAASNTASAAASGKRKPAAAPKAAGGAAAKKGKKK